MKTTSIAFCDGSIEQIVDHQTKKHVLDSIRMCCKHSLDPEAPSPVDRLELDDIKYLLGAHALALAHPSSRFWLFCTELEGKPQSVLVERRVKPGYPFPKMIRSMTFSEGLHHQRAVSANLDL